MLCCSYNPSGNILLTCCVKKCVFNAHKLWNPLFYRTSHAEGIILPGTCARRQTQAEWVNGRMCNWRIQALYFPQPSYMCIIRLPRTSCACDNNVTDLPRIMLCENAMLTLVFPLTSDHSQSFWYRQNSQTFITFLDARPMHFF